MPMQWKKSILILLIPLLLSGCAPVTEFKNIRIAVTGSSAVYAYDMSFLNGVQMAVEDSNAQYAETEFTVETEFFDDGYDFEQGMLITNKIAEDPTYTAVLGSHSFSIADAAAPVLESSGKIMIAGNSMMDKSIIGKGYCNIFRNTNGEKDMASSLAQIANASGTDRLAVCHSNTEFETNFTNRFCESAELLGLSVLHYSVTVGSEQDFDSVYRIWKALGINGVLICRDAIHDAFTLAKYIRERDPTMKIYGDFSFDADDKLKEYEIYVEGIVIPVLVPQENSEQLNDFNQRYTEKYGIAPTWWAAHGYDSTRMIVDTAIRLGSANPSLIAEELHRSGYKGIAGETVFDTDGILVPAQSKYMNVNQGVLTELEGGYEE